ncbi:hypothetical protein ACI7MV_16965, partial [Pseudomonas sp. 2024-45]
TEGVTFKFATPEEKASLRYTLQEVLKQRAEMRKLKRERKQANRIARSKGGKGHTSAQSVEVQQKINYLNWQLDSGEKRLAASISPIVELPDEQARLFGATPERAGLTVIFPNEGQRQAAGLMRDFRNGVKNAPALNVLGDGAALLLFVAQAVNLVQVSIERRTLPVHEREWTGFTNAILATGAAGFAAAQGVFDTALSAQAKVLGKSLQSNALSRLNVTIGKLHVGLGAGAYLFGFLAALVSLHTYHNNWVQAVRNGNRGAQNGAILTMIASGGLAVGNAYGGGNLAIASYELLKANNIVARKATLELWGARLSSVFARVSLMGGVFTLLELAGMWLYNRYNTSAHDQWLQSLPWSQNLEKRKDLSLEEFHNSLTALLQAPFVEIRDSADESYWRKMLPNTKAGEIFLVFPGLDISTFQVPLVGIKRHALMIGAQRITTINQSYKNALVEQFESVTEQLHANLSRVVSEQEKKGQGSPLLIKLIYPLNSEVVLGKVSEELLVKINLQSWDKNERVSEQTYHIRFNALEKGRFPSADRHTFASEIVLVEVQVLELDELQ